MDALDAEGSGLVRYGDFASFFTDTAPLSKAESDLAERWALHGWGVENRDATACTPVTRGVYW